MFLFRNWSDRHDPLQPMSRAKYAFFLGTCWFLAIVWVWAWNWVFTTDRSVLIRIPLALVLIVTTPSVPDLFRSYSSYLWEFEQSTSAIRPIDVPNGPYDRATSLRLLAEALEMVLETSWLEHAEHILAKLPKDLHPDVGTVLGINVGHFLADFDIRRREEDYRRKQELDMRNLIRDLRSGEPLAVLMEHDFL